MNEFETGLRHRLRRALRQTALQHQRLRVLYRRLDEALESGAVDAACSAAERLHAALKAHFELEDAVIFPAFHGLVHRSAHDLNLLARDHRRYLAEFEGLRKQLEAAGLAAFAEAYRSFAAAVGDHERREEELLTSLEETADSTQLDAESTPNSAGRSR